MPDVAFCSFLERDKQDQSVAICQGAELTGNLILAVCKTSETRLSFKAKLFYFAAILETPLQGRNHCIMGGHFIWLELSSWQKMGCGKQEMEVCLLL